MKTYHFLFILILLFKDSSGAQIKSNEIIQTRVITLDFNKVKGKFSTMFKMCIGAGRANEGLRADWQAQLAYVKKECDFQYIRMHGLLTDDMGVYSEDAKGNPEYNFQYIDVLYDFIMKNRDEAVRRVELYALSAC